MRRPSWHRRRAGIAVAVACAVCCVVELAVLGAFGTLAVGAVLGEATEFVPVLLAASAAAAAVLVIRRRRRRHDRAPQPVPLPMPMRRRDGEGDLAGHPPAQTRAC